MNSLSSELNTMNLNEQSPLESWQLLHTGSPAKFVEVLCKEALQHPATNHPYLKMIAEGRFPDTKTVLQDYAYQYSVYSREFPNYVEAVIGGLERDSHREVLLENLEEEKGIPGSSDPSKMPHVQLFNIFKNAAGVNEDYLSKAIPCKTALVWRDLFLQKCQSRQIGVGVGALGIGTEFIVPKIYNYFIEGIKNHTNLTEADYFFFTLHANCDAHHAQDLNDILIDLASNFENRESIRFGVHSALNLRKAFWDVMLSRAMYMNNEPTYVKN